MSGDGWSDREEFGFNHDVVQDELYLNPIFAEGCLYRAHSLMRDFKSYVEKNKDDWKEDHYTWLSQHTDLINSEIRLIFNKLKLHGEKIVRS